MGILRVIAELFAPDFQQQLGWVLTKDNVQGLHLSFDRYWYAWALGHLGPPWEQMPPWPPYGPSEYPQRDTRFDEHLKKEFQDSNKRVGHFPDWSLRCRSMGYPEGSLPFVFRVILRDESRRKAATEFPRFFRGFPITYEVRPIAVGLAAPTMVGASDDVGRSTPPVSGTAGGFLQDALSGGNYVLSCAHVLGSIGDLVKIPGGPAGASAVKIGTVVRSILPPANPPNSSCSARTHPQPHNLDVALAELDPPVQPDPNVQGIGKPVFVSSPFKMLQGDRVSLVGQKSGHVDAEIDSVTIFHEIDIENKPRCFGNVYSLCPPRPWYLNSKLVKFGDSGSWILRHSAGMVGWDGILFAGDGAHAYACFAEDSFLDARSVSPNLTLFP